MARHPVTLVVAALLAALWPGPGSPALAAGDHQPAGVDQTLKRVEHDLNAGRDRQTRLDRQSATLKATLAALRARLVEASDAAARQQATLNDLEASLASLTADERHETASLATHRREIATLVGALYRLDQTPPEALIARPEAPVDALRTAVLLRYALPILHQRAETLASALDRLQELRRRLKAERDAAAAARIALAGHLVEVANMVAERETIARETEAERRDNTQRMATLAAHATDLRQLLDRIEADRRQEAGRAAEAAPPPPAAAQPPAPRLPEPAPAQAADQQPPAAAPTPASTPNPAPSPTATEHLRLPAAGRVVLAYGDVDRFGAISRGVHIQAAPETPVVAPLDGTIKFAGRFRNYGQILIVEHGNGYHSLIAGLGRIDTAVGRPVSAGEPIGLVADPGDGVSDLYFELRRNGQPINPRRGIPALDGKG